MRPVLIWDLPTRLFHWLLAAGFIAAAIIALVLGDDSALFPYHAIIGLTIALLVCLRLLWGAVGTRYARLGTFVFAPTAVMGYMSGMFLGSGKRHIGHNPGSAYAIFAMLGLVIALAATGIMMARGDDRVKDLHEILSYVMLGVVVAHVLGVAFHMIRHRENIIASMVHGKKDAESGDAIPSSRPLVAIVLLAVAGAWAIALVRNYDSTTQTTKLPMLGASLQLGESENFSGEGRHGARVRNHDDDDD